MSLYKTGTASLAANGIVTGVGTNWTSPLSLIRKGNTMILNNSVFVTIDAILSSTSIRVVNGNGATVPNGPYVIMLTDAISVDGLAQDVAETLRYYQNVQSGFDTDLGKKLDKSQNLNDVPNKNTARTNIGAIGVGDYGVGSKSDSAIDSIQGASGFYGSGGYGSVGFQSSYGVSRRGQIEVGLGGSVRARFCNTESNDASVHPWSQVILDGDYGIGAVNPPSIGNSLTERTGFYTALTENNGLGSAWSIQGQAVGLINLGMHHNNSNAFKSQIATSYGSDGRVFYRCSLSGAWKDWKEVALSGSQGFELGNNSKIVALSGQLGFQLSNRGKGSNDPTASLTIAVPAAANERAFLYQSPVTGNDNAVLSRLPSSSGVLAVQGTSGREFKKNIVNADPNEALDRVSSLRLTNFVYNDDDKERVRFGFIAEEAELIAPQYIKRFNEPVKFVKSIDENGNESVSETITRVRPCIDNNPIVMDLIGCVQALKAEIEELKKVIASK